ncbi:HlyD family secretion protein [Chitinophaga sancti]|uniref:HlyD family secretion protein n=1 Tax=Chitinophaga sancti TaxID=1004 RepID=UPI003F7AB7CE
MKTKLFYIPCLMALFSCGGNEQPAKIKTDADSIHQIAGIARIEPEKGLLYVYADASGCITAINALENQLVTQGTTLLTLESATDQALLEVEESKINTQGSAVTSAEKHAGSVLSELNKARTDLVLNEQLYAAKGIAEQTLKDSQAKVEKLSIDYEKLRSDIQQEKGKLQEINANIRYRKSILSDKVIKAAFDGKVLQWDVHKGDFITQGQKLGQFAPGGPLIACTEVDELFADQVHEGMKAAVFSQSSGAKMAEGTVIYVAGFLKKKSLFSDENTVEDRRVKEVKIRLSAPVGINNRVDCAIYLK